MVVAVIPRPEPMLRGEDRRGPHFRVTVRARAPPPIPQSGGSSAPNPLRPGTRAPPPPPAWGPGALSLRPLQGLESGASPNSLSPAPVRGLEPSIHTPRAPDLPVSKRPHSRAPHRRPRSPAPRSPRPAQGPGCVLGRGAARPSGPRPGAQPGVRRDPRMPPAKRWIFRALYAESFPVPQLPLHPGPSTCVSHRCQIQALQG